jgi:hypothetical protein
LSSTSHHDSRPVASRELGSSISEIKLASDIHQLAARHLVEAASAQPAFVTVRRNDTLSSIAKYVYGNPAAWTVLYYANHRPDPSRLKVGRVLHIPPLPRHIPAAPAAPPAVAAPVAAPPAATAYVSYSGSAYVYTGGTPGGAFGACVVARESGGNAQIMNSTGHYGLYQFSESTWITYGGSAADFGHATVAEQEQVFANALAAGGESNWSPYDGC